MQIAVIKGENRGGVNHLRFCDFYFYPYQIIFCLIITLVSKDTLEDVSLGQLGRLYIKTDSLSKLSLTEARRSLEGRNALPRTEHSFVFHIVEWKVLDSYNSACSAPYLQTKGK